jgi:hypothetical protein
MVVLAVFKQAAGSVEAGFEIVALLQIWVVERLKVEESRTKN